MTKEELKQEAEESFEQYKVTDEDYVVSPYSDDMGEKMLMFNYEYEAEETYLRLYTQGYLAGAEPREKQIEELERKLEQTEKDLADYQFNYPTIKELEKEVKEWKDKADLWCNTANLKDHNIMINKELEKENADLKEEINKIAFARGNLEEENAGLKEELKKWKDEWQEQVQKATDEGYARTLQTVQLTKAIEIIKKLYTVYYDPCVTESDLKYRDELFAEIKQFISEVGK